ncbi:hypothetical protein MCEMZLE2_00145 [Candidatus Nanopelagicaceae bacterium]
MYHLDSKYFLDMSDDNKFDFALERIRALKPSSEDDEYLLEISWLYDRIVKTGSAIPVIDLAYELVLSEDFIGECVSTAMEVGFIKTPKRGSNGGEISQKALRLLKQTGRQKN